MDKLLKLSQEHGEVFESLTFFKKAMSVVNLGSSVESIGKFDSLFREDVAAHFAYEENKIFPPVLKSGLLEAQQIVRQLQADHITIYGKLDMYKALVNEYKKTLSVAKLKKISQVAQEIISLVVAHARKEDAKFFPLVKKLGIKL